MSLAARTLNVGVRGHAEGDVSIDFERANGPTVCAMGEHIPFRPGTFRTVLIRNVLEHTPLFGAMVKEAQRVLAPGGALVLRTDNAAFLYYHWRPGAGFWEGHRYTMQPGDQHYALFKPHHLQDLAAWAGFASARVYYSFAPTTSLFAKVFRRVVPVFDAAHLVMLAAKEPDAKFPEGRRGFLDWDEAVTWARGRAPPTS